MDRFERIIDYLLKVEGGYSNDKNDKGGETKYGIIEEEARDFGYKGNMQDLTIDFAKRILEKDYYLKNRLNEVKNDKVALSICDWSFNSGKWATKKAQVTLNRYFGYNLVVDGIFGNKTIKALNEVEEQGRSEEFLRDYHDIQRKFYHSVVEYNPTQKVFLTGWLNRVDRKEKYLKEMM
mgnify:CR=1 FL=1